MTQIGFVFNQGFVDWEFGDFMALEFQDGSGKTRGNEDSS
jgi:hypothetical protein